MFSSQFSIHKKKKNSKSVNKHYILAKILNFNSGKKISLLICLTNRRGLRATGQKKYTTCWERPGDNGELCRHDKML